MDHALGLWMQLGAADQRRAGISIREVPVTQDRVIPALLDATKGLSKGTGVLDLAMSPKYARESTGDLFVVFNEQQDDRLAHPH